MIQLRKLSRMWIAATLILVAIGVGWWVTSPARVAAPSQTSAPPPAQAPTRATSPQSRVPFLQIEGTQLTGVDEGGQRQWELQAKTLQINTGKDTVTLSGVSGQLYQSGTPRLAFTAPSAVFFVTSKNVELSGGVIGRTPDRRTLRAALVRWDARRKTLTASGGVTVTQPGMTIRADQVTSDAGLQQTTFTGHIMVKVTE